MSYTKTYSLDQINRALREKNLIGSSPSVPLEDCLNKFWLEDRDAANAKWEEINRLTNLDSRLLSKAEIINLTWSMPPLTETLYGLLSDTGFKTGSTVYGSKTEAKDVDWCIIINPNAFHGYCVGIGDQGYWEQDGFSSIYAHYNRSIQNIICFSNDKLYTAWLMATEAMKVLASTDPPHGAPSLRSQFRTKWCRVRVFRALRDICTPPPILKNPIPFSEAIKYSKCSVCGQEAINFTCKEAKLRYLNTAVCERCES